MNSELPVNGNQDPQTPAVSEFQFTSDDEFRFSSCAAFQDLMQLLINYALSADQNIVESTHQIRKKLKFFRAFTKLLKPGSESSDSKYVNSFFRDHGRVFSDLRDAHVRTLLLTDELYTHLKPQCEDLQRSLCNKTMSESEFLEEKLLSGEEFSHFARSLRSEPRLNSYFCEIKGAEDFLLTSYVKSFSASGAAFDQCRTSGVSEELHEWRKRLKDVQYQLELIQSRLTDQSLTFYGQISSLCTVLGDVNDLSMLIQWLTELNPSELPEKELKRYLNEIRQQSDLMVSLAFEQGGALYSHPGNMFEGMITEAIGK